MTNRPQPIFAADETAIAPMVWAAISAAVGLFLLEIWARGQHLLGHDSYYYIEIAKRLSQELPNHFGDAWPFGLPLVAAALIKLGIDSFTAYALLAYASLFLVTYLLSRMVSGTSSLVTLSVFAFPLIPGVFVAMTPMSEVTFSALLVAFVFVLPFWQNPKIIYLSAGLIVVATSIRYIGLALIPASIVWWVYLRLRTPGSTSAFHAAAALGLAVLLLGIGFATNILVTGHVSGISRGGGDGVFEILRHASDFGLSAISLFSDGAARILKQQGPLGFAVGLILFITILAVGLFSFRSSSNRWIAPSGIVILGYSAVLITLRSLSSFDDLSASRFLLPIAPLLFFNLLLSSLATSRAALTAAGMFLCAIASMTVVRGASLELSGDIEGAKPAVLEILSAGQTLYVNSPSLSLAAYVRERVVWYPEPPANRPREVRSGDILVVSASRQGRTVGEAVWEPGWKAYIDGLLRSGEGRLKYQDKSTFVLQFR